MASAVGGLAEALGQSFIYILIGYFATAFQDVSPKIAGIGEAAVRYALPCIFFKFAATTDFTKFS